MAPPKPPNPSSKEILEEAIQISTLNLNNAMQETQEQMDERFTQLSSDLSNLQTRLDNDKSEEDSRFQALMAAITKISLQKELQQTLMSSSGTVHGTVTSAASATVHGSPATVHGGSTTVHGTASPSGMVQNPLSNSRVSAPNFHSFSPTNTPMRNSATYSTTNPHTATMRYTNPHMSTTFVPYPPIPSILTSSQPFNVPFSQHIPFSQFSPQPTYPNLSHIPPLPTPRTPKLELPMFDGSEPLDWLFQAEQFFNFYNMPPENRLSLISFYMKGAALSWFKWMHHSHLLMDWASFTRALELRFGPSTYDNHQAELFKLKQDGTVVEYQTKFEQLGNQVVGLPHDAILNCFISGLNADIRNEMAIQKPTNISQAIGLAKLIEAKLKDSKPKFSKPYVTTYPKPNPTTNTSSTQKSNTSNSAQVPFRPKSPYTTQPAHLPIKKLSQTQIQERRAQGLCFNCDEKFIPGHKCSTGRFLILLSDEEVFDHTQLADEEKEDDPQTESADTYFQLSTHALTGQFSPQTLKFKGLIGGLTVMVLVDTGSTHNILQPRIAHHLNLPTTPIPQFSVMVGNGSHLQCEGICNNVKLTLQDKQFKLPFYLLPIEGADVVLGMAWLRTLGTIQADFSIPSITFNHNNASMTLEGDSASLPQHTTFHQFKQLVHQDSISSLHLMFLQPTQTQNSVPPPNLKVNLPDNTHPQISTLLHKYPTIFQNQTRFPPPRPHDHQIPLLPNTAPINVKPYRYPHSQKTAMTTIISDMLKEGLIVPSHSPFSSPVLLVKKKDGTWRFCVDYRALNAVTVKDRFPIPTIDELLDELGPAKIFTKLDLRSGYHQIRMASKDTHKTAFRTFDGHYEFLVMPFGLTNAPLTFQSAMNDLLRPYLRKFVLVFFDDILIYSSNFNDHLAHLQVIFKLLAANCYVVKLSKCVFAVPKVHYLGHVICEGKVGPDAEKIKAILDWPQPRSLTALRGFLGLTGFYRRFVKQYAALAAPLTDLLRSTRFVWSTAATEAFTALQKHMTDMPVLTLPDFKKKFIVETDASGVAVGAVLSQDGHPIAFFSKKMCPRMQASSTYVREMFAVTEAVKKWRQYLIGQEFHIYTDQKSLRNLLLQKIQTPEQQKWAAKLQGFNFEIFYKPGKSNVVADALSRQFPSEEPVLFALSSAIPDLLTRLRDFYTRDRAGQELLAKLFTDTTDKDNFKVSNGLLLYKNRLFIPDIDQLRTKVLNEFHATPTAGHSGVKASLSRVSASFAWPGIYKDVKHLVKYCDICQHSKYSTQKKKGLLQPLPVPEKVWDDISMDFITHLPNSFGHTCIWVICDRLSKSAHFIALSTKFTAKDIANRFTVDIARLHGSPRSIVTDRDPLFLSKFWKEFHKLQGTTLKYSTAYHPETDGQTEVLNRSVETYLRCFASSQPRHWYKYLHLAEYWYNTSYHSAIKTTPFRALYGRDPPSISAHLAGSVQEPSVEAILQQHHDILQTLKSNLVKSRIQMEKQANVKRLDYTFKVNDLVLLKLQPYRQHTVHRRSSQKLAPRFFGPFTVIKRIGQVAYMINLPSSSRIHPVVHVSLLRPYFGTTPEEDFEPIPPYTPVPLTSEAEPHLRTCEQQQHIITSENEVANNKVQGLWPSSLPDRECLDTDQEEELNTLAAKVQKTKEGKEKKEEKTSSHISFEVEGKKVIEEAEENEERKRVNNSEEVQRDEVIKLNVFSQPKVQKSKYNSAFPMLHANPRDQLYPTCSNGLFSTSSGPSNFDPAVRFKPHSQLSSVNSHTPPPGLLRFPHPMRDVKSSNPISSDFWDPRDSSLSSQHSNDSMHVSVGLSTQIQGPSPIPSMNLEDKVPKEEMSIDRHPIRPKRIKRIPASLKDFYY
ncbi:uncharacterized protein LOC131650137 [Vicia villosa]|uniref:uncharacterized protein LOC131650137 n=1 Tax=Vicia villosa TaxID=3911 RepID=UPI00273B6A32|nr:uncharacterized protein LOC131650137 [Vicia villosa]